MRSMWMYPLEALRENAFLENFMDSWTENTHTVLIRSKLLRGDGATRREVIDFNDFNVN